MRSGTLNAKGHSAEFQFLPNESCRFRMADAFRNAWDPGPMARGIQNGWGYLEMVYAFLDESLDFLDGSLNFLDRSFKTGRSPRWVVCLHSESPGGHLQVNCSGTHWGASRARVLART